MVHDGTRPCDRSEGHDGGIDLETVNVDKQRHILEGIYRSRRSQSAGASLPSTKRVSKRGQRIGSSKRAREMLLNPSNRALVLVSKPETDPKCSIDLKDARVVVVK